jgi:hypothetical protein
MRPSQEGKYARGGEIDNGSWFLVSGYWFKQVRDKG